MSCSTGKPVTGLCEASQVRLTLQRMGGGPELKRKPGIVILSRSVEVTRGLRFYEKYETLDENYIYESTALTPNVQLEL